MSSMLYTMGMALDRAAEHGFVVAVLVEGSWLEGRFLQATMSLNRAFNDEKPDVDCGGAGGLSGPRSLRHGVNAGFADGSVRFISAGLKPELWQALATRAGGEVINPDDL